MMQIQTLVAFNLLLIIVDDQPERIDFPFSKADCHSPFSNPKQTWQVETVKIIIICLKRQKQAKTYFSVIFSRLSQKYICVHDISTCTSCTIAEVVMYINLFIVISLNHSKRENKVMSS